MSWERAIKKEWDIRDINRSPLMQRREDKRGHYDRPPKRDIRDKCIVRYCAAQSCKYNSEKNCTLRHVDITKDGRCRQFRPQEKTEMTQDIRDMSRMKTTPKQFTDKYFQTKDNRN